MTGTEKIKPYELYGIIFLIIAPLLLIFQGFSGIDEGFIFSNAYYFFTHPESISFSFSGWYLTDFFGGLFEVMFKGGYIGGRLLWVFSLWLIFYIVYLILGGIFERRIIIFGCILSFLFINTPFIINWFDYNLLSSILYLLALLCLIHGMDKNKNISILCFGVIIGINFFARLPNIVGILFIIFIPFYYYIKDKNRLNFKEIYHKIGLSLMGVLIGISIIITIIYALDHLDLYIESMSEVLLMGEDGGHHSLGGLIAMYLKSYGFIAIVGSLFYIGVLYIDKKIDNEFLKIGMFVIIGIIFAVVSIYKFTFPVIWNGLNLFTNYYSFIFPFLACIITWEILKSNTSTTKIKYITLISITLFFILPLGSGAYVENMRYGSFLMFPIFLEYAIGAMPYRKVFYYSLIGLASGGGIFLFGNSYIDSINRLSLKSSFSAEKLQYIYSTKENTDTLNELFRYLIPLKGSSAITVGDINYVYSVIGLIPYLNSPSTEYVTLKSIKNQVIGKKAKNVLPDLIILKKMYPKQSWHLSIENFITESLIQPFQYRIIINTKKFIVYKK